MKVIGLLMVRGEDDILGSVLQYNVPLVDAFYVLDGTTPNDKSAALCQQRIECCGYWCDGDLPERYGTVPRDGWRDWLLLHAVTDWGVDNLFVLLHGDEVWTCDPREVADAHRAADGFVFNLPVYFPHAEWQEGVHPFDQITWSLGPGWPELRMFRGSERTHFDPDQHFNVTPQGVGRIVNTHREIKHYPYRSPEVQRARARQHFDSGFDPDNYRHIVERDEVIWTPEVISRWQASSSRWRELRCA